MRDNGLICIVYNSSYKLNRTKQSNIRVKIIRIEENIQIKKCRNVLITTNGPWNEDLSDNYMLSKI
jgi:hypothetical protein